MAYHGACDIVFLRTKLHETKEDLLIHIRTTIHKYRPMSYISEVSVSIGSSLFQVISSYMTSCKKSKVTYVLDGTENAELPSKISTFPLHVSHPIPDKYFDCIKPSVFTIKLNDTENIRISFVRGYFNVEVTGAFLNFGSASGLIGTWEKGMVARDGETLIKDPITFAEEWQVRSEEPNLFKESMYPQYPAKCLKPPSANTDKRRRLDE